MLILIPLFLFLLLLLPVWRFLAAFLSVSIGLWVLRWSVTTSTPGVGKYVIALVVLLLAFRAVTRLGAR